TWYDPVTGRNLPFRAGSGPSFALSANGNLGGPAVPGTVGFANPPGGQPDALSQDPANALLSTVPPFDLPGQNATFTSPPLARPVELVGSPTVRLAVSSSTPDLELFVKLYDVASDATVSLPGGQVAPIRLAGLTPGAEQTVTVTLPSVVQKFRTGDRLRLAIAATDAAYANLTSATIYRLLVGGGAELTLPTEPVPPGNSHTAAYAVVAAVVVIAAAVIVLTRRRPAAAPVAEGQDGVAVVIAHLSKQFRGVRAVDDLTITIGAGQVFGLLGPNGAGKTTTIRMLLGLIYPTAGSCAIFGETIRPGHPVLARVGTLVEGPKFVPHLSGIDNLRLYWRAGGRPLAEAHIDEALVVAGLGEAVNRPVKTYSQGMRQRLGIAQALLGQPELMILDEPTNGLDPQQMFEMRQVIRALAERGITVLLSSHLLGEVEQVCTHVAIMDRGRLVAAGTVAELIAGSPTLYVEVDDVDGAVGVLEAIGPVQAEGPGLVVELNGTPPAEVARALVRAGIGLSTMTPRRHLEDVFIGLIEDERGGAAVRP
ncbi:MAG TPA: ATP-binding cassette domain-containing protein, partial [Actinomycetota bacterium]|nr:ATP-binding cassette domain-containing protein [Actinomycetota bacterium]